MSQQFYTHTQCQTCLQHFPSQGELRTHIETFRSRIQYLLAELYKALAHAYVSDDQCVDRSEDDTECFHPSVDPLKDEDDRRGKFICPHSECENKPKNLFNEWKNFLRHYTIHVTCNETCAFCGCHISRVRKYVTHYDDCKARKSQEEDGYLSATRKRFVIQRRKRLCRRAADELQLKMNTMAEIRNEEGPRGGTGDLSATRKRPQEESCSNEIHQNRKRHISTVDGVDASAPVRSDMPHQALSESIYPAQLCIPTNGGFGPMAPEVPTVMGNVTIPSGFNDQFHIEDMICAPYSVGNGAVVNQLGPAHTRAPLLFSHTMDGSSTYSAGSQYEGTAQARVPLLSSHLIEESPNYPGEQLAGANVRAPLLSSHTMDGCPSASAHGPWVQAKIPLVEHHTATNYRGNPLPADDGMAALYGTLQPILPGERLIGYT